MNNVNDSRVQRYENGHLTMAEEHLAAECMIQIIVNDALVTTLLGSPEDVEELVAGHLMTEHAVDVQSITNILVQPSRRSDAHPSSFHCHVVVRRLRSNQLTRFNRGNTNRGIARN